MRWEGRGRRTERCTPCLKLRISRASWHTKQGQHSKEHQKSWQGRSRSPSRARSVCRVANSLQGKQVHASAHTIRRPSTLARFAPIMQHMQNNVVQPVGDVVVRRQETPLHTTTWREERRTNIFACRCSTRTASPRGPPPSAGTCCSQTSHTARRFSREEKKQGVEQEKMRFNV